MPAVFQHEPEFTCICQPASQTLLCSGIAVNTSGSASTAVPNSMAISTFAAMAMSAQTAPVISTGVASISATRIGDGETGFSSFLTPSSVQSSVGAYFNQLVAGF